MAPISSCLLYSSSHPLVRNHERPAIARHGRSDHGLEGGGCSLSEERFMGFGCGQGVVSSRLTPIQLSS